MDEIIMKTKNKLLMALTVFLILFILIGSVSAADDNTTALSQDNDKAINQEEISTGNDDSSLEIKNKEILKTNDESAILKTSVSGHNFSDIQDAIDDASGGDTIELTGEYKGNGKDIAINKDNLIIVGKEGAKLDAQGKSRILNINAKGVILKDITFQSGLDDDHGGAVCIKDEADVTFINCVFDGNNAKQGGAFFVNKDAKVSFTNCSFNKNTASELSGGAVYVDEDAEVSFTNCSFNKNTAKNEGGAVYLYGNNSVNFASCSFTNDESWCGVVSIFDQSTVSFTSCSFFNNNGRYEGGVIYAADSKFNFTNCSFTHKTHSSTNDLLTINSCKGSFTNCLFDKNTASYVIIAQYGALNLTNCSFTNNDILCTVFFTLNDEYNLINCSFANNKGFPGTAVFMEGDNVGMANFINCSFDNNYGDDPVVPDDGGGAVEIYNTGASFINCSFNNNTVVQVGGGAVYIHETYSTYFQNCSFINNKGPKGGAVLVENDGANFTDCSFINNHAPVGGAVYVQNDGANFAGCSFTDHSVKNEGGAVYIDESGEGSFNNCSFTNNNANTGGAVFVKNDGANFTDCSFTNNSVDKEGGAVYIDGSGVSSFNNCSFTNNNASTGGAIYTKKDKTLIKDSKFTENNATVGQAIKTEKDMSISNSEFRGNGEYCIDVKLGANVTTDNVLYDAPLINEIFMKILEAKDVVYGNNVSIKVQVNSSATTLLNIGKVVVKINKVEYESDVKDGIATLVIPKLDAGSYNVNVRYDDINEPKAEIPVNFNVTKASAEIIIANDTLNVQVSDSISTGATLNPAEAGNLTYASSDSNVAIVENNTIKALSIGTAVITVSSTGNNNYDVADEKKITVNVGARIWYVDDDAGHVRDGRSKETAFKTFQDALDVAGHDDIIMIAEGSYSYGRNVDLTINTENLTIMKYGDGEAIFDAREECTIWDCGVNINIIGLTFKGARSQTIGDSQGGALNLVGTDNDNVHVKDCKFINNAASYGGAMFIYSGTVTNCTFIDNRADSNGGAVFMQYGTITACTFINNTSPHGGAICCGEMEGIVADTCIFKSHSDGTVRVTKYAPTLNDDIFTTVYNSGEKLTFVLKTHGGMQVDDGIISISIYNKTNGASIANHSCLSGEGWTVDLPVGNYYAILNTEYAEFKPVNRTINVLPDIEYYVNVIPTTSNNLTVDLFAKSNIPQDIVEGKLQFILPNGTQIEATLIHEDEWWAQYTFDDYGDYLISASYTGLSNVTINNDTIIISTKPMSTVNITDVVLNYGEGKNITVNTTGATGITAKINNVDAKVDGFTIEIPVMDAGDYTLRVTTIPDNDYSSVTKIVTITVNKMPTEIVIANDTLNVSMIDLISTGASLTPADAGNLTYTSSNSSIVVVENGKIKPLSVGTAVITVSFEGNADYAAAKSKTITVNVSLCNASVSVVNSTLDLYVGNTFAIVAVTTPAGLNVTYVPDDSGVVSVDENGVVTALKNGTGKITVKVGGDGVANENSTVVTVNVKPKEDLNIKAVADPIYIGENLNVVVTGLDKATGNVTVRVDNKTYSGPIVNGTAKVVISGLTKNAIAYVDYDGDMIYNPSSTTVNITVNKIKTTITVKSVTVTYNGDFVFTLKDVNGNPVSGVKISVVLGKSKILTTNKNGQVKVSTSGVVPKAYNAKITFNGNDKYANSAKSVKVTVKKATPKLTAKAKKFKRSVKTKKYTVTLKTNKNKVIKKAKLILKVKGKIYKAKTNSKGKATFKITKLTKKGKYKAKIKFAGNKYYKSKTVKVKITVK